MTEPEARQILRRYQDWRKGKDIRNYEDAFFPTLNFPKKLSEAIEFFAAETGKIDCRTCSHCLLHEDTPMTCGLKVKGMCKQHKRATSANSAKHE